jgi:hypothetical protein
MEYFFLIAVGRLRELIKGSIVRGKRKKEGHHNSGIEVYRATDGKIREDYFSTLSIAPIVSFWQKQIFLTKRSEFYKEYLAYAKRMTRITEELTKKSLKMTQLCIELSENAQHFNELYIESMKIAEAVYKSWLNVSYDFWNRNEKLTQEQKKCGK